MLCCIWDAVWWLGAVASILSFTSYFVLFILDNYLFCEQNLKKRYNAEWALVTGASSGIGRALTEKLAAQGISVVMVALEDKIFPDVFKTMKKNYPDVEFKYVPCNLGTPGYLDTIKKATEGIDIQLLFNNAGYIRTGLFADNALEAQRANYECNATAPMLLTHYYANQMLDKKMKGAICFTSSPAGLFPNPTAVLYGATKAFLTEFATSLAPELYVDGVDVLVVHPSPVDTGFYSGNVHDADAMKFFQKTATTPVRIASCFFRSLGRTVVHDQGYFPVAVHGLMKLLDLNFLAWLFSRTAHTSGDFYKIKSERPLKKKRQ